DIEEFSRRYPAAPKVAGKPNFVRGNNAVDLKHAITSGHCYIQDPSTALACEFVEPQAGEKVLDACAAPGGKTGYLAELMQNQGLIVACDRAAERLALLDENMTRMGAAIVETFPIDWIRDPVLEKIAAAAPFDRVLIDAPCT